MNFLGSGREWGVNLSYAIQHKNNGGIADALLCAEGFAQGQPVAVVLGDNIFEQDFTKDIASFTEGVKVFFKAVKNPSRFGVPVFDTSRKNIVRIEEKPKKPKSSFAQTGFYLYDNTIFSVSKTLTPSARGELEITDAHNIYLKKRMLAHGIVKGFWSDAGTFESLLKASNEIAKRSYDFI
jgi:glucose-1-phosphate thymidylyltransferase